jgi:hypothetical protein
MEKFKSIPPGPLRCEMVRALVSLFLDVAQPHGYELAVRGSIIRTFSLKRNTRTNSLKRPQGVALKAQPRPGSEIRKTRVVPRERSAHGPAWLGRQREREARGSPSLHLLLGCTAKDYSDNDDTA